MVAPNSLDDYKVKELCKVSMLFLNMFVVRKRF